MDTSIADLVIKYADRPQHPLFQLSSCILEVDEHREHKRVQRVVYNRHTNSLRPKEITIECDWRKKGHLPITEDEAGSAWYNHTQYALFGVAIYWCDENGDTQHHSVDVLSQSITEDSHCSLEGLRTALRQVMHNPMVPCDLLGATKIHFWSDTGPHFRSHEYLHFCLKEFPQTLNNGARFDVNYLAEKHGKNQRDSHFRCVRSYTMRAARGASKAITTCSELKECLIRAHAAVQTFNTSMGLPEESCDFYLLNLPISGTYAKKEMKVSDLCSTYAMRMVGDDLFAYTNSMYKSRVQMQYSCISAPVQYRVIVPPHHEPQSTARLTLTLKKRRVRKVNLYANAVDVPTSEPDTDS